MEYWKRVNIGDYESYAPKFLEYHYKKSMIDFWNPIKLNSIKDTVPELIEGLKPFGEIKEISLLVLNTDSSTLHIDHTAGLNAGVEARINIPILNVEGSITAFFELEPQYAKNHFPPSKGGTISWPPIYRDFLKPITTVIVDSPTILRTSRPHTVYCKTNKFPRITLTISLMNDVVNYLN